MSRHRADFGLTEKKPETVGCVHIYYIILST